MIDLQDILAPTSNSNLDPLESNTQVFRVFSEKQLLPEKIHESLITKRLVILNKCASANYLYKFPVFTERISILENNSELLYYSAHIIYGYVY